MNALGRAILNSPARAYAQEHIVIPLLQSMGATLAGCRVLEIGCGRGVGTGLVIDALGALSVDAIDLDPRMVRRAERRLRRASAITVSLGDMTCLAYRDDSYDAVVDFGAMHIEPRWRISIREIHRVLKPGGRFLFEQVAGGPYRLLTPLATGRRVTDALTARTLIDELRTVGFEINATARRRALALTGTVGDLVGLATKR